MVRRVLETRAAAPTRSEDSRGAAAPTRSEMLSRLKRGSPIDVVLSLPRKVLGGLHAVVCEGIDFILQSGLEMKSSI